MPFEGARAIHTDSPQFDALLACARVDVSDVELRSALAAVTDWQRLRDLALRHAMLPMLYSRVVRAGPEVVPTSIFEELQLTNRANAERSIRLTTALLNILASLHARGIAAAAFKGPVLSEYAYGDVTLRTFQDLDLFVAKSDLVRARQVLEAKGFRDERKLPEGRRSRAEEYHQILRADGVTVELHWRTGPAYIPPAFQADELLRRSHPATLLGRPVLTLDPADLLLALCVHGHSHRWSQLELVAALARVLAKGEFGDPGLFLQGAQSRGCLRRCLVGALMAKDLAGAELPQEFEAAIASDRLARCLASKAIFLSDASRNSVEPRFGAIVWQALALDKPKDAVRLAALRVFAPREVDMIEAGSSRSLPGLAHLMRIRRLLRSLRDRRRRGGRSNTSSHH
jgi:hypothetical protein